MTLKLKDKLILLLNRREYSAFELTQKMLDKGFPEEAIDHELSMLQEEGLQSDRRFCESMCRHYSYQGKGPLFARHELVSRGVDSLLIEQIIEGFHWQEAYAMALRKLGNLEKNTLKKRLYNKGFPPDFIATTTLE